MEAHKLGRYRLVEKIGAGGMGEVWRARDESLDRDVALKMLPAATAADPERRKRFEREAKAVAGLQHPNIVTLHSIEEADGAYFLTMELVRGRTLSAMIPPEGFPLERIFELGIPLADAVHAAHEQGVIHRDLKPGNVMVDDTGRLRVLDFGLAKLTVPSDGGSAEEKTVAKDDGSTKQGQILGTVAYMSPEQAEGKPLDRRSDIFSLGVILYQMATGQRPFRGDTPISTLSAILKETPPSVTSLKPLPRHLGRIIHRCLEKSPDRRFQTARDVCNELEGLKREMESGEVEPVSAASASALGLPAASAAGRRGRATGLWVGGAVVVAAAAVTWAVLTGRSIPTSRAITMRPLTGAAGVEYVGSWSPDGSFFAYSHVARGPMDIFVQSTAGGDPICLVESPADDGVPAWSPDNRWIAFLSGREGSMSIYTIPPLGGTIRKLVDTGFPALTSESDMALGPSPWSPDGQRLAFTRMHEGNAAVWITDLGSGAETQLTHPSNMVDGMAAWSPDGKRIAFLRGSAGGTSLWVVPVDGGEPREVRGSHPASVLCGWSPDSKSLVFSSNRSGGIENLWVIPATGGDARQLTSGSIDIGGAAVGRDGRILYCDFSHQTDLYLQDLSGGEARRLTFHTESNFEARFSPQGDRIVYDSDRTGNTEIWVLDLASGKEARITDQEGDDGSPDWSPDGSRIVFSSSRPGPSRLWIASAEGGAARPLGEFDTASGPRWAPDGAGIGFIRGTERGPALWITAPDGKEARPLLEGVVSFDWDRDSRHVIYQAVDAPGQLRARDLETGREVVLLDEPNMEAVMARDGSALTYCAARSHFNMNLHLLPLTRGEDGLPRAAGPSVALTAGQGLWHVHNGSVSPDGKSVVYTRDTDTGDVYVLEGAF